MFVGGVTGWCVLIPMILLFGADATIYPGTATVAEIFAQSGPSDLWSTYVKYIGAGAIATGGFISLIKSLPLIVRTFSDSMKSLKGGSAAGTLRTEQDLNMKVILIGIVLTTLVIWLFPAIPVNLLGAVLIVVFGFFFATVSSRMVGLVGILLAILAVFNIDPSAAAFLEPIRAFTNNTVGGIVVLAAIVLLLLKFSLWGKNRSRK